MLVSSRSAELIQSFLSSAESFIQFSRSQVSWKLSHFLSAEKFVRRFSIIAWEKWEFLLLKNDFYDKILSVELFIPCYSSFMIWLLNSVSIKFVCRANCGTSIIYQLLSILFSRQIFRRNSNLSVCIHRWNNLIYSFLVLTMKQKVTIRHKTFAMVKLQIVKLYLCFVVAWVALDSFLSRHGNDNLWLSH